MLHLFEGTVAVISRDPQFFTITILNGLFKPWWDLE